VCRAVTLFGVIGPYIFEDDKGIAVTGMSDWFIKMPFDFLVPDLG
jgi:hypothetical protein